MLAACCQVTDHHPSFDATTMSSTVAELYSLLKCLGTCLYLEGLWADVSGEDTELHLRTDASNLVTTAKTRHRPEQNETIPLEC